MRTQEELIERYKSCNDMFGFESNEYLSGMTVESLESLKGTHIKEDADLDLHVVLFKDDQAILDCCKSYMEFAWEKANGCRGISAYRSIMHYKAWLWMIGEDGWDDIEDFQYYGKDELVRICNFLGIDSSLYDDGIRTNSG
jgi:hypothetical protein